MGMPLPTAVVAVGAGLAVAPGEPEDGAEAVGGSVGVTVGRGVGVAEAVRSDGANRRSEAAAPPTSRVNPVSAPRRTTWRRARSAPPGGVTPAARTQAGTR